MGLFLAKMSRIKARRYQEQSVRPPFSLVFPRIGARRAERWAPHSRGGAGSWLLGPGPWPGYTPRTQRGDAGGQAHTALPERCWEAAGADSASSSPGQ